MNSMGQELRLPHEWSRWTKLTVLLIICYTVFTRSFAYLGLPTIGLASIPLFVGEGALGAFLVMKPGASFRRWFAGLATSSVLTPVSWALYAFVIYGLFQALRGVVLEGYPVVVAVQSLVFNLYPIFLFLGLWVGLRNPDLLPRLVRWLAWFNGIYGVFYILVLSRLTLLNPGSPQVPLFTAPGASVFAILGLLIYFRNPRRDLPLLIMNALVLLGLQVRAFWVAFVVGVLVWGLVKHQFTRIIGAAMALIVLLSVAYVLDVSLPATNEGRGEISARNIIGAALAPIDEDLASEYTDAANRFSGTTEWRKDWWAGIWRSVHENPTTTLIGHGYGFPLSDVVTFIEGRSDLRTPHNIFFYALGYGGWIGIVLFGLLLTSLARLLWRSYRASGDPFGLVILVMGYTIASFGNYLETPFGAIPFYLLLGLATTPAFKATGAEWLDPTLLTEERHLVQAKPQPSKSSVM